MKRLLTSIGERFIPPQGDHRHEDTLRFKFNGELMHKNPFYDGGASKPVFKRLTAALEFILTSSTVASFCLTEIPYSPEVPDEILMNLSGFRQNLRNDVNRNT